MLKASSLAFTVLALILAAHVSHAQQIHLPPAISQGQGMGSPPVVIGNDAQKQQAIAANLQRQAEIRRDTEKMLQLNNELKDYLDKAGQGVVSMERNQES